MFHADDLIAAIRRRQRRSLRPEQADTNDDRGLERWLGHAGQDSRPHSERPAGVLIAATQPQVGRGVEPEPAARSGIAAWLRLWRQQWGHAPRDQRRLRWFAALFSGVLNLGFAIALLWLMYLRFVLMLPAPSSASALAGATAAGDVVVPMRMLASAQAAGATTAPAAAAARARSAAVAQDTEVRSAAPRAALQRVSMAPQQLVRVSAPVPAIRSDFQLPEVQSQPTPPEVVVETPTNVPMPQLTVRAPDLPQPALQTPVLHARASAPQLDTPLTVQAPALPTRAAPTVRLDVQTPALHAGAAVPQLEAHASLPDVVGRTLAPTVQGPALAAPALRAGAAAPALRPAPAADTAADAASNASAAAASSTSANGAAANRAGNRNASAGSTAQRAAGAGFANDDWGRASRGTGPGRGTAPGSGDGLFGADGRPKVEAGDGALPVDRFTDKVDLANEGRWLRRPPNNFQPTVFDKYWIPSGTLLEEWVRRGVKEMSIPVPGTKTSIVCVVSILQLGGACYPSNPDINDQPVHARPPPAVPFKRQYQQAQDALAAPGTPPQPPSPLPPAD